MAAEHRSESVDGVYESSEFHHLHIVLLSYYLWKALYVIDSSLPRSNWTDSGSKIQIQPLLACLPVSLVEPKGFERWWVEHYYRNIESYWKEATELQTHEEICCWCAGSWKLSKWISHSLPLVSLELLLSVYGDNFLVNSLFSPPSSSFMQFPVFIPICAACAIIGMLYWQRAAVMCSRGRADSWDEL